ncbi:hypothetical protein J6590_060123 [Homalodisca vitripennis]|nr:hypothetical protein J6590_060123 [Homalodisca vitripennis]
MHVRSVYFPFVESLLEYGVLPEGGGWRPYCCVGAVPLKLDPIRPVSTEETYVKRFRTHGTKTVFKFNPVPEGVTELNWIRQGFLEVVDQMKSLTQDTDHPGFTLSSLISKTKSQDMLHSDLLVRWIAMFCVRNLEALFRATQSPSLSVILLKSCVLERTYMWNWVE